MGGICKMRDKSKKSNKVCDIMYSSCRGNEATNFGKVLLKNNISLTNDGINILK